VSSLRVLLVDDHEPIRTGIRDLFSSRAGAVASHHKPSPRESGVLIAALNPYRQLDAGYRGFIDLLAGQIAATLPATALPKTDAWLQALEARG
jgi:hypothetical protein